MSSQLCIEGFLSIATFITRRKILTLSGKIFVPTYILFRCSPTFFWIFIPANFTDAPYQLGTKINKRRPTKPFIVNFTMRYRNLNNNYNI